MFSHTLIVSSDCREHSRYLQPLHTLKAGAWCAWCSVICQTEHRCTVLCDHSVHRIIQNCSVTRSERMSQNHNSHPFCLSNFTLSLNDFYPAYVHVVPPLLSPPSPIHRHHPATIIITHPSHTHTHTKSWEKTMPKSQVSNCDIQGVLAQPVKYGSKTQHLPRCNWNPVWPRCDIHMLSWYYLCWTLAAEH